MLSFFCSFYLLSDISNKVLTLIFEIFLGNVLQENAFAEMAKQTETFRSKLENFAHDHKNEIRKDPEFRRHFQGKIDISYSDFETYFIEIVKN